MPIPITLEVLYTEIVNLKEYIKECNSNNKTELEKHREIIDDNMLSITRLKTTNGIVGGAVSFIVAGLITWLGRLIK